MSLKKISLLFCILNFSLCAFANPFEYLGNNLAVPLPEAVFNYTINDNNDSIKVATLGLERSARGSTEYRHYHGLIMSLKAQNAQLEIDRARAMALYREDSREIYRQDQIKKYLAELEISDPIKHRVASKVYEEARLGLIKPSDYWSAQHPYNDLDQAIRIEIEKRTEEARRSSNEYNRQVKSISDLAQSYVDTENNALRARVKQYFFEIMLPLTQLARAYSLDVPANNYNNHQLRFLQEEVLGMSLTTAKDSVAHNVELMLTSVNDNLKYFITKFGAMKILKVSGLESDLTYEEFQKKFANYKALERARADFREKLNVYAPKPFNNPAFANEQYKAQAISLGVAGLARFHQTGLAFEEIDAALYYEALLNIEVEKFSRNSKVRGLVALLFARQAAKLGIIQANDENVVAVAKLKVEQMKADPSLTAQLLNYVIQLHDGRSVERRALSKMKATPISSGAIKKCIEKMMR